jgi:hypothetical protein
MAEMVEVQAKDVQIVLREVNDLKVGAMIFLGIMTLIVLAYISWRHWLGLRRERDSEKSKERRAEQYTSAITTLAESMNNHTAADEQSSMRLNNALFTVTTVVGKLDSSVNVLSAKTAGTINREDSVRMIRDRFLQNVFKEICMIVERSLSDNDYDKRRDFVARKVRTAIGEVLGEARAYLCSFNLSVDPNRFFQVDNSQSVERFLLCDLIWNDIETLYRMNTPIKQRIEEAYLMIENSITDYVTKCNKNSDTQIHFREAKGDTSSAHLLMARSTRLLTETGKYPSVGEGGDS